MKKLNKKGFTLIELLAVIVILGVLMLVAIPAVTRYIENSKKKAFISNANAIINAGIYQANYDTLNFENSSGTVVSKCYMSVVNDIRLEKSLPANYSGYFVVDKSDSSNIKYSLWLANNDDYYIPGVESSLIESNMSDTNLKKGKKAYTNIGNSNAAHCYNS